MDKCCNDNVGVMHSLELQLCSMPNRQSYSMCGHTNLVICSYFELVVVTVMLKLLLSI